MSMMPWIHWSRSQESASAFSSMGVTIVATKSRTLSRSSSSSGGKLKSMAMTVESATDVDPPVRPCDRAGTVRPMRGRYLTTNGIRMFAVEEGSGPLVLLVHGFPEFWWSWRSNCRSLADAGYRAVAIDLPGYGRSDKPDVTYDEPWLTSCLAGLIPALGAEQCVIAGHDWGGLLVWPFARRYPELLAGVVGVNTPDLPRTPMPIDCVAADGVPGRAARTSLQFQDRGPAEYILGRDIRGFFEAMLRGPATRRPEVFDDDAIDTLRRAVQPRRCADPAARVLPQPRPQLGARRRPAGDRRRARRSWCRPPTIRCSHRPWPTGWRSGSPTCVGWSSRTAATGPSRSNRRRSTPRCSGSSTRLPRWS